jgi:hypothetical protein
VFFFLGNLYFGPFEVQGKPGKQAAALQNRSCPGDEGEFDAAPHGVDALGAHANAVAEFPDERGGGFAAAGAAAARAAGFAHGDDSAIALAKDAAGARGFFERADGKKTFDEEIEKLDEASVFLNGNDEAVELVAEPLLHVLRGFPGDEFALGGSGTALGLGSFRGNFLEMLLGIERGFGADDGLDERGRRGVRMSDGPFQDAMDDEIGITANGRSEVGVFVEAERKVAKRIGGVARLLQRTQHEIGENALLGLAGEFLHQALVMLRRDA